MTLLKQPPFAPLAASLPGSEHQRLNRNNQDGLAIWSGHSGLVAVVTDGCSAGRHSEVGAQLGARFLAAAIGQRLHPAQKLTHRGWIDSFCDALTRWLESTARMLAPDPTQREGVIADYLLFTFLAAIVTPRRAAIIGLGDGAWAVNGRVNHIEAGVDNAPPYLAYRLVDELRERLNGELQPRVHFADELRNVSSLLVASDGLRDLERCAGQVLRNGDRAQGVAELVADARLRRNPSLLQKRLQAIAAQSGPLRDDLTMALLSRREGAPCA